MAAIQVMARLGPVRLTLADVAREIGLSPATLVQRFGSKRGLLL
ncbi:MAG: TetR/AcrR family transcriptional regulator, partial [Acidobacteria bacterium]|nr:TetR/AcrR family transcriptional regulator [Acidobacteriota bacterium]